MGFLDKIDAKAIWMHFPEEYRKKRCDFDVKHANMWDTQDMMAYQQHIMFSQQECILALLKDDYEEDLRCLLKKHDEGDAEGFADMKVKCQKRLEQMTRESKTLLSMKTRPFLRREAIEMQKFIQNQRTSAVKKSQKPRSQSDCKLQTLSDTASITCKQIKPNIARKAKQQTKCHGEAAKQQPQPLAREDKALSDTASITGKQIQPDIARKAKQQTKCHGEAAKQQPQPLAREDKALSDTASITGKQIQPDIARKAKQQTKCHGEAAKQQPQPLAREDKALSDTASITGKQIQPDIARKAKQQTKCHGEAAKQQPQPLAREDKALSDTASITGKQIQPDIARKAKQQTKCHGEAAKQQPQPLASEDKALSDTASIIGKQIQPKIARKAKQQTKGQKDSLPGQTPIRANGCSKEQGSQAKASNEQQQAKCDGEATEQQPQPLASEDKVLSDTASITGKQVKQIKPNNTGMAKQQTKWQKDSLLRQTPMLANGCSNEQGSQGKASNEQQQAKCHGEATEEQPQPLASGDEASVEVKSDDVASCSLSAKSDVTEVTGCSPSLICAGQKMTKVPKVPPIKTAAGPKSAPKPIATRIPHLAPSDGSLSSDSTITLIGKYNFLPKIVGCGIPVPIRCNLQPLPCGNSSAPSGNNSAPSGNSSAPSRKSSAPSRNSSAVKKPSNKKAQQAAKECEEFDPDYLDRAMLEKHIVRRGLKKGEKLPPITPAGSLQTSKMAIKKRARKPTRQ